MNGCGNRSKELQQIILDTEVASVSEKDTTEPVAFHVYVCGQVLRPGVYILGNDERICDAIDCAGGMTPDAAIDYLNLAQKVEDGMKVYIPSVEEAANMQAIPDANTSSSDGKININTANKDELMTLPGIGNTRAESIINYREKNGSFSAIEDIMLVSGIKESSFEMIREYITVK